MKNYAYKLVSMIILVASMAVAAQAQTSGSARLIANIPFDFKVGDKTLPAGEYTVRQVNPASDRVVLQISTSDGRTLAMVQMNSIAGKTDESTRLVFNRYGDQHFLAEAWIAGEGIGLKALRTRAERAVEREMAGMKPGKEDVALMSRK